MKHCKVLLNNKEIYEEVRIADSFLARLKGLMFKSSLKDKEGLLLKNCSSIHCCFMRFPIDVIYLDNRLCITGTETVYPWHLGHSFKGSKHVLEVKAGTAAALAAGEKLSLG